MASRTSSTLGKVFPPARYGSQPVVLLDGGMGTTLQAPPFELSLDSALWSSELLATEQGRAQLAKLHSTWVEAGAQVVETCTYQSSLPLFLPTSTSYSPSELSHAQSTMLSALPVATSCCSSKQTPTQLQAHAALSLGPFGASLQPGQEYGGLYPAPFCAPDAPESPSRSTCADAALAAVPLTTELDLLRSASASSGQEVPEHELHLAAWHLQRLMHFSASPSLDDLALLAFETVPVLAEARAIRRAMAVFNSSRAQDGKAAKPFYISFVFPRSQKNGEEGVRFPDPTPAIAALPTLKDQASAIIAAALAEEDEEEGLARPAGLGFNCTSPLHASTVVSALSNAVSEQSSASSSSAEKKPWLILYPDGGATYDVQTRSWHTPEGLTDDAWANKVANAVQVGRESGAWSGTLVGGCCKAGPKTIGALKEEVERRGWLKERK
ncbi:hypothetical protein JCM11641_002890 [Rhodosporidiobolus odoratus]